MEDRFDRAGRAFASLCRTLATLRAPGGCPWDREQTLASLGPHLVEETYEAIDALDRAHMPDLCEELGDVLLQVAFQAEIAQEGGAFDAAAVADGIRAKLVRRHPHVFGDAHAPDAAAVARQWEAIKATERPADKGPLDGIPRAMPGLLRAWRTAEKAAAVGFDWPDRAGPWAKLHEELGELNEAVQRGDAGAQRDEMGDVLFALVNVCRHLGLDPEAALRGTIDKFHARFAYITASLHRAGEVLGEVPLARLEQLWQAAKRAPAAPPEPGPGPGPGTGAGSAPTAARAQA